MQHNITRTVTLIFVALLLYTLLYINWFLFSNTSAEIVTEVCKQLYLPHLTEEYQNNSNTIRLINMVRGLVLLIDLILLFRIYSALVNKNYLLGSSVHRAFDSIGYSLLENYEHIKTQDRIIRLGLLTILSLQFISFSYLIIYSPYSYDEVHTYTHFSGIGIFSSMAYYPLPNNHILHNVCSVFFLSLPIGRLVAIRLISFLASFVSTFYFYKMASKIVTPKASILATALFSFSYPFVLYSNQARGYSLIILFAVLCCYAYLCIINETNKLKYIILYSLSSILGFYAIPSFLYFFVVINALMLLTTLIPFNRKRIVQFITANLVIAVITFLLYLPIIQRNSWEALSQHSGLPPGETRGISELIKAHLYALRDYIAGTNAVGFDWIYLLLGIVAVSIIRKNKTSRYTGLMIMALILSPVVIINIHQTVPFTRTWSYLIIPICLAIAIVFDLIGSGVSYLLKSKRTVILNSIFNLLVIAGSISMLYRYDKKHKVDYEIDYVVNNYTNMLEGKIKSMTTYSNTYGSGDMAFYLSEGFAFKNMVMTSDQQLNFRPINTISEQPLCDFIVLDKKLSTQQNGLDLYQKVNYENDYFILYIRKDL